MRDKAVEVIEIWATDNDIPLRLLNEDLVALMWDYMRQPTLFDLKNHGYCVHANETGTILYKVSYHDSASRIGITSGLFYSHTLAYQ